MRDLLDLIDRLPVSILIAGLVVVVAAVLAYFLGTHLPEGIVQFKLSGQVYRAHCKRCYGWYRVQLCPPNRLDISNAVDGGASIIYANATARTAKGAVKKLVQALETTMKTGVGVDAEGVEIVMEHYL